MDISVISEESRETKKELIRSKKALHAFEKTAAKTHKSTKEFQVLIAEEGMLNEVFVDEMCSLKERSADLIPVEGRVNDRSLRYSKSEKALAEIVNKTNKQVLFSVEYFAKYALALRGVSTYGSEHKIILGRVRIQSRSSQKYLERIISQRTTLGEALVVNLTSRTSALAKRFGGFFPAVESSVLAGEEFIQQCARIGEVLPSAGSTGEGSASRAPESGGVSGAAVQVEVQVERIPDESAAISRVAALGEVEVQIERIPDESAAISRVAALGEVEVQIERIPDESAAISRVAALGEVEVQIERIPDESVAMSRAPALGGVARAAAQVDSPSEIHRRAPLEIPDPSAVSEALHSSRRSASPIRDSSERRRSSARSRSGSDTIRLEENEPIGELSELMDAVRAIGNAYVLDEAREHRSSGVAEAETSSVSRKAQIEKYSKAYGKIGSGLKKNDPRPGLKKAGKAMRGGIELLATISDGLSTIQSDIQNIMMGKTQERIAKEKEKYEEEARRLQENIKTAKQGGQETLAFEIAIKIGERNLNKRIEAEEKKARKKAFEFEKGMRLMQVATNTALAFVSAASAPFPLNIVQMILAGLLCVAQAVLIAGQQPPPGLAAGGIIPAQGELGSLYRLGDKNKAETVVPFDIRDMPSPSPETRIVVNITDAEIYDIATKEELSASLAHAIQAATSIDLRIDDESSTPEDDTENTMEETIARCEEVGFGMAKKIISRLPT